MAINELSLLLDINSEKSITRSLVLKIEFDRQRTVYTPISEFFGTGVGVNPFTGWYRSVTQEGQFISRWVMPYQKTAKVTLLNMANTAIDYSLQVKTKARQWTPNSLYFHASWRGGYPVATRPFYDWNYVKLKGRGVYVGDILTIYNPVERWWGEGDEKIFVDGEKFTSIFGTGTEDYYGYYWGRKKHRFLSASFSCTARKSCLQPTKQKNNRLKKHPNIQYRNPHAIIRHYALL